MILTRINKTMAYIITHTTFQAMVNIWLIVPYTNYPINLLPIDISKSTKGYSVSEENIVQKALGLEIPLLAKGDSSLHGILIRDLVVDIVYETKERLHVKVTKKKTIIINSINGIY